ncbi:retrovirus-related pol polyprotein from transposon TNT 1-94 [Tanacetum coccineum]
MKFLLKSLTTRIKEQVKDQLPQILPKEVSNFAPPMIEKLIKESRDEVTLAKVSSQLYSTYEAASTLTEFELKKILINKIEKSESYLCGRKDKDKDEDPSTGSDRGLKKRKTSKDAEPTTYSDMPQDQEGNPSDNDDEPRKEDASRRDWFKKPTPPQEPTDPDWHEGKTPQKRPTHKWLMTLATSTSIDKSLKDFDELMSTPIDFFGYILNGLKIKNLTQEILNFQEKLDWENPEGGDYPFDLSKPLPLITHGKRQRVPFEYFINNDLKYLQGGVSTMTYTASTTKTKATQYDLSGIEDMVPNIWSPVKVAYDKYALWGILHWREQRKSFYAYARGRQSIGDIYSTKHILAVTHVKINDIEDMLLLMVQNRLTNLSGDDVDDFAIALRCSPEVWLFKNESKIFNLELKVIKNRSTSPSLILQDQISEIGTRTLHTKTLKDSFMSTTSRGTEYRHGVLAEEKMEHIGKEKSSFHDQGHQQAAKGKEDDEEFGEICWRFDTSVGNPVKEILLKLNLPDHRSILTDSKVTPTKHGRMTKPYLSPRFIAKCSILRICKDGDGALDEYFSSRNHVRKFLRALPTKWRLKVTTIEESKDLSTLPQDELIGNLKVYEVVLEKDLKDSKIKKEKYKSLALKARKVSSDKEESRSGSDEEYAIAVRYLKKFFRRRGKFIRQPYDDRKNIQKVKDEKKGKEERRCFKCGGPNHFISDCSKHFFNNQKAFVGGCWSDSKEEDDSKKDEICLIALDNNEVCLKVKLEQNEWIKDSGCSRHMTSNKDLFSTYEAINGGVETIVYADSNHAGDYVDRKSTSGVYTFMRCRLTLWFSRKQTALAISTTEAEYIFAEKACQQALWMKQALVDYDIKLDDIPSFVTIKVLST